MVTSVNNVSLVSGNVTLSIPTDTTDLTNLARYITSGAVGDGKITFTQGGVTKGSITTNQSGNTTIAPDADGGTVNQTYSSTSTNVQSGVAIASAISGKANTADLAKVATSESYNDLTNTPTIPTVNDSTIIIQKKKKQHKSFRVNTYHCT